ncbi:polyprenyl synthetase family protein [Streptomyces oryzae]|uniref:Polyprenyl synthetase family protein n=1 Tax=Streptomyces oryzae TaxID=1434886 RepID=A0ABS3XGY6_9ACTN|nr:polyprenyl synthetase family protein [Streptomyces oryzae]MBO8194668.1 polyprenyl synthetase family protein [Streptomyces oryzae]
MTTQELTDVPAAPSLLAYAHERTEPVLREAVGALQPELRRVCGYHFGWTRPDGSPTYGVTPGPYPHAALALHAAGAGEPGRDGVRPESSTAAALPGAAAVELVHNWAALHDDVMDGEPLRRGRSAVWAVYGTGWAVLAGDALLGAATRCLLPSGKPAGGPGPTGTHDETAARTQGLGAAGAEGPTAAVAQGGEADGDERAAVLRLLTRTTSRLISGRSAELALRRRAPEGISVEEYAAVAAARTSSLLECALAGGALLGGHDERVVETLTRAGHHLGIAVQAARDIEDLWSGTGLSGRPVMSGLREGGPSLPLIAALRAGNPAARTLAQSLGGGPACPPPPDELADLIENAGGRAAAHEISAWQLAEAYAQLDKAALPPASHTALRALFRHTVTRT